MTIILLLVIQLIRFDIFLNMNSLENIPAFAYSRETAVALVSADREAFTRKRCLVIHTEDQQEELTNIGAILQILQFQMDTMKPGDRRVQAYDYDMIIMMDQNNDQLADREQIISFAKKGGRILYLGNGSEAPGSVLQENAMLFGIEYWGDVAAAGGFDFQTELLSGLTGLAELDGVDSAIKGIFRLRRLSVSENCMIHATDREGYPFIWECHENGNTMVINTGSIGDRHLRGLLTGAISVFMGTVIYPVTQSAVYQIVNLPMDDQIETDILRQRYNRSYSQFILDVWWQDLVYLMKKNRLKYSLAFCGLYDNSHVGLFTANEASAGLFGVLSKTVLRNDGEITCQGLNQQDFPDWQGTDIEAVEDAIRLSAGVLQNLLPNYAIRAYVYSGSMLDEKAGETRAVSFPEVAVISSPGYFTPATEENNQMRPWFQEFTATENGTTAFPQVTAGYLLDDATRFMTASVVTMHGLVSHAIRADDILNTTTGVYWEDMYRQYGALFMEINKKYPWLSNDTISTAAAKLEQSINLELYYSVDDQSINIVAGGFTYNATLILVTGHEIIDSDGCDFIKIDSMRYLITMHEKTARLEVRP